MPCGEGTGTGSAKATWTKNRKVQTDWPNITRTKRAHCAKNKGPQRRGEKRKKRKGTKESSDWQSCTRRVTKNSAETKLTFIAFGESHV